MRIFLAGATGATGNVFLPMAKAAGHDVLFHVRPQSRDKTALASDKSARIFDLADASALRGALAGCDVVVSLIGTMRRRFDTGDTYESSDIGTTRELVAGARDASVRRFLLLSSHGAGGIGAYLKAKRTTERIVEESGLACTIFRPSMLVSPADAEEGAHGKRTAPPGLGAVIGAIGFLPGLRGWADDAKPIPIEIVCRAFLRVLAEPADTRVRVLEGRELWTLGTAADRSPG